MKIFWFIPTHGDSRYLGTAEGARQLTHDYLKQVAQAADSLGYEGVLIPTGRSCEDPWVVAASLLPVTQRLKFLIAMRAASAGWCRPGRTAIRNFSRCVTGSRLAATTQGSSHERPVGMSTPS